MPIPLPVLDADKIHAIRLFRSARIGPRAYHKLCESCESFEEAFETVEKRARELKIADYQLCEKERAQEEYQRGQDLGAEWIVSGGEGDSEWLHATEDRPPFLWAWGQQTLLKSPCVAIIGSRNPTLDGVRITLQLSKLLSYEGVTIVSGLARGIDAAAHEAALSGGTIGVVAGGVDIFYPKSNTELQKLMSEHGLVVSEMPFGYAPQSKDFPRRNRIIAGLAQAVVVVEGNSRSGTRLTVMDAERYGRLVLAVPGSPLSGLSALPNELIVNGLANLVRNAEDILIAVPNLKAAHPMANPESHSKDNDKGSSRAQKTKDIHEAQGLSDDANTRNAQLSSQKSQISHSKPSKLKELSRMGRALIEGEAAQTLDGSVQYMKE